MIGRVPPVSRGLVEQPGAERADLDHVLPAGAGEQEVHGPTDVSEAAGGVYALAASLLIGSLPAFTMPERLVNR